MKKPPYRTVADLHSKILDMCPPWEPNSFNFRQFFGKIWPIHMLAPPPWGNPGSTTAEWPQEVILYGGFAPFSLPIGWISHVIMHSNMVSSLEKMEIVGFNNFEESVDMGNITASQPALGSLEKLKQKYIYYSYADLQYHKSLRHQRLLRDRQGFVISHPASGTFKNAREKREQVGMEWMQKKARKP